MEVPISAEGQEQDIESIQIKKEEVSWSFIAGNMIFYRKNVRNLMNLTRISEFIKAKAKYTRMNCIFLCIRNEQSEHEIRKFH